MADKLDEVIALLKSQQTEHAAHHEWIRCHIDREKQGAEFWRDVRKRLTTAGLIGIAGVLCSVIWYGAKHFFGKGF